MLEGRRGREAEEAVAVSNPTDKKIRMMIMFEMCWYSAEHISHS